MYAVIRQYTGAQALSDILVERSEEIQTLLRGVQGFVSYYAVRDGDRATTITMCDAQAGADESVQVAAQWVREQAVQIGGGAPQVSGGDVILHFDK
jgi:hypothetical protein